METKFNPKAVYKTRGKAMFIVLRTESCYYYAVGYNHLGKWKENTSFGYWDILKADEIVQDKKVIQHFIKKVPVKYLRLSKRLVNVLSSADVDNIADILEVGERELLSYQGFGGDMMGEIKSMLKIYKLKF